MQDLVTKAVLRNGSILAGLNVSNGKLRSRLYISCSVCAKPAIDEGYLIVRYYCIKRPLILRSYPRIMHGHLTVMDQKELRISV